MITRISFLAGLGATLAAPHLARAQDTSPTRIIVPFAAGGPADLVARTLAARMSEAMGQTFVIENRDGAGGNIGTAAVARAAPDGKTLLLGTNGPLVINVSLLASMPFDPLKDFSPISHLASVPLYLAVPAALPAQNVKELIAMARAQPGAVSYASSGIGSGGHLAGGLLAYRAGVQMTHVAYRGAAPATTDLLAGRVQMLFVGMPVIEPHLRDGRVRVLAVVTPQRTTARPDIPTVAEAAELRGFEIASWYGLLGPAGMPPAMVARLNAEANRALHNPEAADLLFQRSGLERVAGTPEEFAETLRREIPEYAQIVRQIGARQE
ncbi:MAG: putative exported protein [Rubritepida sp.]|nr:putative exported protein [Rubritepida sp.]